MATILKVVSNRLSLGASAEFTAALVLRKAREPLESICIWGTCFLEIFKHSSRIGICNTWNEWWLWNLMSLNMYT